MCLAVPMKVTAIEGPNARCAALGTERTASLALMAHESPVVGDWVIISQGMVQRTVPEDEALESLKLFEEIAAAVEGEGGVAGG